MVIKQISLMHKGGAYHYRLHNQKLNELSRDYPNLIWYLNRVFEKCPDDYFFKGPRSSALKFKLNNLNMHQIIGHEVSDLCYAGLKINKERYKTSHSKVQVFMLEKDDKTVGVEIPIWVKKDELNNFNGIFQSEEPLTGHIDILRVEGGKIWVWDYKPKAFDEKYAATQVFFYSLMLSKRSGIPLSKFRCGYFDEKYAFIFKPELKNLIKESLL
tara:strand:- start:520 stop:1161 length:642 start_codon:yes stop_codon:yes gene_type:complete